MYTISKASAGDAQTIRQLAEKTWWPAYSHILGKEQISYMLEEIYLIEKLKKQIEKNLQTYILLTEGDEPVAFAAFSPRDEDAEVYKLHKLYCLPQTQGKGYGKVLINEVMNEVINAGKHTLDLNVNRYNKAKTFYEKMGFEIIYEEDIAIGPYFMNDYVMRKAL
jgi:GNAT superfamily N-acetyltransferase